MDIRVEILKEHSKRNAIRIANYIHADSDRFRELMDLFLGNEVKVTQRAAQVVTYCADQHSELIAPYLKKMINALGKNVHVAARRNILRILQDIELPGSLLGSTADICFNFLTSKEPIAVKVFAMTVLANICEKEPALSNELQVLIEDQMPYGSAGFKSRGSKVLKQLKRLTG